MKSALKWFSKMAPGAQHVLVLVGPTDTAVQARVDNLLLACRSARLCVTVHNVGPDYNLPSLSKYSCIVMATKNRIVPPAQAVQSIESYIYHGGGFVGIMPPACPGLTGILGLHTAPLKPAKRPGSIGPVRFHVDLFPGLRELELNAHSIAPFAQYSLDESANNEVVAEVCGWGEIGWRRPYGAGQVFVWNSNFINDRAARGLLVQSILNVHKVSARAIANIGVVWIDDFPAGVTDRHAKPVSTEFGFSYLRFLDEVWLPDMLELAENFGISYSFAIPFTYNARNQPPFDFEEWELEKRPEDHTNETYSVHFAKKAAHHGELCLHGYNHLPMTLQAWKSSEMMVEALRAALSRWQKDGLGPLPKTYVPPMNEYDAAGAKALPLGIPGLENICGGYVGGFENGGSREFDPEPWNADVYCMPRVTWGYELSGMAKLQMVSVLASLGVWTHFLHPDQILDIDPTPGAEYSPQNPDCKGWRKSKNGSLLNDFTAMLTDIRKHYPWLRYKTASPAADILRAHFKNRIAVYYRFRKLIIKADAPCDVQLRLSQGDTIDTISSKQGELLHRYDGDDHSLITLRMNSKRIALSVKSRST